MAANVYRQAGAAMSFWSAQCQANAAERCPALRLGDSSWSMTGAKAVAHRRSETSRSRRALLAVTLESSRAVTGRDEMYTAAVKPGASPNRSEDSEEAPVTSHGPASVEWERPLLISARSSFRTMAGVVAHTIRRGGACQVQVYGDGTRPLSRALQVLSTAKLMLRDKGDVRINFSFKLARRSSSLSEEELTGTEPWGMPFGHLVFQVRVAEGSARELQDEDEKAAYEVFRVKKSTDPGKLCYALWYAVQEGRRVVVECVGLGALEQAFHGLTNVRRMLFRTGLFLYLDPEVRPVETEQGRLRGYKLKLETKDMPKPLSPEPKHDVAKSLQ